MKLKLLGLGIVAAMMAATPAFPSSRMAERYQPFIDALKDYDNNADNIEKLEKVISLYDKLPESFRPLADSDLGKFGSALSIRALRTRFSTEKSKAAPVVEEEIIVEEEAPKGPKHTTAETQAEKERREQAEKLAAEVEFKGIAALFELLKKAKELPAIENSLDLINTSIRSVEPKLDRFKIQKTGLDAYKAELVDWRKEFGALKSLINDGNALLKKLDDLATRAAKEDAKTNTATKKEGVDALDKYLANGLTTTDGFTKIKGANLTVYNTLVADLKAAKTKLQSTNPAPASTSAPSADEKKIIDELNQLKNQAMTALLGIGNAASSATTLEKLKSLETDADTEFNKFRAKVDDAIKTLKDQKNIADAKKALADIEKLYNGIIQSIEKKRATLPKAGSASASQFTGSTPKAKSDDAAKKAKDIIDGKKTATTAEVLSFLKDWETVIGTIADANEKDAAKQQFNLRVAKLNNKFAGLNYKTL